MMKNLKTVLLLITMVPVVAMAQGVNHRKIETHRRVVPAVHHRVIVKREAAQLRARQAAIRERQRRERLQRLEIAKRHRIELARKSHLKHVIVHPKHKH